VLAQLDFRLLTEPAPVPLAVAAKSGVLSTSGRVDREQVPECRGRSRCQLTLDVTVRPPRYFQVLPVVIIVIIIVILFAQKNKNMRDTAGLFRCKRT